MVLRISVYMEGELVSRHAEGKHGLSDLFAT